MSTAGVTGARGTPLSPCQLQQQMSPACAPRPWFGGAAGDRASCSHALAMEGFAGASTWLKGPLIVPSPWKGVSCSRVCAALAGALLSPSRCCPWLSPLSNAPVLSWFHGKISGLEAVQELQPPEDGLFLVRESVRHPGDYVLCVSFGKEVIHYRVVHEENTLSIDSQQYFSNLIDMIEVRRRGRGSHECQSRARTSWAHTEAGPCPVLCGFHWCFTWCNSLSPSKARGSHSVWDAVGRSGITQGCLCKPAVPAAVTVLSQRPHFTPIPAYSVLHRAGRPWRPLPPLDFEAFCCVSFHSKSPLTC